MTSPPYFSIIIPTYNRVDFILNTLDTVFNQQYADYEVIVVDNCSTDNTLEALQPLIDEGKIRFIQHDKNYERAKSRNTGMQNAQGEYLTFLDSDDFMYPDNLLDAYNYAQQHPDKKVFHNLYELVDEDKKVLSKYDFQPLTDPVRQISEGNFLSCIGVFVHRDIYQNISWDETPVLTGSEDYDFALRLVAAFPAIGRINKFNNGVLDHPARTINTAQLHKAEERFEYFIKKLNEDKEYAFFGKYLNKIKATLYIFLAGMAKDANDLVKMKNYIKEAYKVDKGVWKRRNFQSLNYHYIKKKLF
ncbi:glycosyltransferase [uncultured Microscilla sp.]|uniref:glycosyltransferase family 2 protein n=1 Tax=uncultured Microscilla sp. TaxID=432653 RepID=UPI0026052DA0|nr:glycosyltransferase [uncultured Microscilla sp.]